jgi:hypothetical protein
MVSVVTDARAMLPSANDSRAIHRRDRIVSVSTLFAEQRPESYRLLVVDKLHDRHLLVDTKIYHLGGSVKDAARTAAYSLTEMEATLSVQAALESQLASATPWYPDARGEHRRE